MKAILFGALVALGLAASPVAHADERWRGDEYRDRVDARPDYRRDYDGRYAQPRHLWVPGYWGYEHGRSCWIPGHWELRQDRYGYDRDSWRHRYGRMPWRPGTWRRG